MSKRGYISRYLLILKKLKAAPFTSFEELNDYMGNQFRYMQMRNEDLIIGFCKRTLQRDLREIRVEFGIHIEYSRKEKRIFYKRK